MKNAINILQEKVVIITFNLKEYIHLKHSDTWKELNSKKREYKKAIKILEKY